MLRAFLVALQLLAPVPQESVTAGDMRLDGFAYDLAVAPDLDGDGFEDLLIADPDPRPIASARGGFWIVSGADGTRIARIQGPPGHGWFGVSVGWLGSRAAGEPPVVAVGEVVAHPDFSLRQELNRDSRGVVHLVAVNGERIGEMVNDPPRRNFGRKLVVAEDLDGDGVRDLVLPVGGVMDGKVRPGSTRIRSGRTSEELHGLALPSPTGNFESGVVVTALAIPEVGHLLAAASTLDGIFVRRTVRVFAFGPRPSRA